MGKPFSFMMEFTGELDGVPGNLHSEADFQNYIIHHFLSTFRNYNPKVVVTNTTDARGVFGGWNSMHEGWIEIEGFERPANLPDWVDVQFRSAGNRYGWPEWLKPSQIWVPERTHDHDRVTAFRFRKPLADYSAGPAGQWPTNFIGVGVKVKPFEVGKTYMTLGGKQVTIVERNDITPGYETIRGDDAADDNGGWRYDREGDRGRTTGSEADYLGNLIPELAEPEKYEDADLNGDDTVVDGLTFAEAMERSASEDG